MPRESLVVVVDDDASFREALVALLDSMDYEARGFASAEDFLASRTADSCACVITDIHMPRIGGFELQLLLKRRNASVPVIMITARDEPGLEAKVLSSGATCLLRKPFEARMLTGCLQAALTT